MAGGRTFVIRLITDSKQTEDAFKRVGVEGAAFNKTMIVAGAALGALMAGMKQAVSAAIEYDKTLLNLTTQIGMTQESAQALGDQFLTMTDLRTGPQELADAFYFIASAGLEGAAAMEAMEYSAKAAAIGMGEAEVIADLLTTVLNAYGTETITAQQATESLLFAVREGKAEASDMAGAIGQVIPLAASMGVSFADVSTSLAILTRNGATATSAVTQLQSFMVSMLQPSKEAEDALNAMGLSSQELRDTMAGPGGLWAALTMIQEAAEGNSTAFADITGRVEALNFLNSVLGNGLEANAELFTESANQMGVFDAAVIQAGQTFDGQTQLMSARWESFLVNLGQTGTVEGPLRAINNVLFDLNYLLSTGEQRAQINQRSWENAAAAYSSAAGMLEGLTGSQREAAMQTVEYQAYVSALNQSIREMGPAAGFTAEQQHALNQILREGADVSNVLTTSLLGYLDTTYQVSASAQWGQALADQYGIVLEASDPLVSSTSLLRQEYDLVAAAANEALDAQLLLVSPQLQLIEAEDRLRQAIADGREVVLDATSSDEDRAEALLRTEEAAARYRAAQELAGTTAQTFVDETNPQLLEALGFTEQSFEGVKDEILAGFDAQREWDGLFTSSTHEISIIERQLGISGGIDGTRATGGPVMQGKSYVVGEQGPELFVPNVSGTIIPNDRIANYNVPTLTGGGSSITVNVSGAIDPEGTARTILRVLEDAQRRTGARL